MTETRTFTTAVARDPHNPERFRWSVLENAKVHDKSMYNFATKREAQADADKFVGRLKVVWRI
jgi:hypothetical protein